jgi:hypothetical protein
MLGWLWGEGGGMRETGEGQAELLRHVASAHSGGKNEESERHPQRAAAMHLILMLVADSGGA